MKIFASLIFTGQGHKKTKTLVKPEPTIIILSSLNTTFAGRAVTRGQNVYTVL